MKVSALSKKKIAKLKSFYKTEMDVDATEEDVLEILICEGYKSLQRELTAKMKSEAKIRGGIR